MKLVHYRPVAEAERAFNTGIRPLRKRGRLCGVYAVPLLDFHRTVTGMWGRTLRCQRNVHVGGIVFEIPDDEMVFFARDWIHTACGERNLVPAREAERLTFEYARERNTPLTPKQVETLVTYFGCISAHDQPKYSFNQMEIIVPRRIVPGEVVSVSLPRRRRPEPRLDSTD